MPRLTERPYTYLTTVRGMCRSCRKIVPARVYLQDEQVWQLSLCPDCACSPALIAGDKNWYLREVLRKFPDRSPLAGAHAPMLGCPHDCGPCAWHASPCQLPVISVTNACNMACPICFTYNRPDKLYFMSLEEMRRTVDWLIESSGKVDLINITGGEPTLHPGILGLLKECQRPEIGRVTMNSNGLRLADDDALCSRLAELGVCVILSFDTFDPEIAVKIHGQNVVEQKLRAIDKLTRAGVRLTLLNVLIPGLNEDSISGLLSLMKSHRNILSLNVQTMTHTGQGGGQWPGRRHLPVDEAARIICAQSGGELQFEDFLPRPSAHPLCYLTCTAIQSEGKFLPLARIAPREKIMELMRDSYLMRLEGEDRLFQDAMNELYAQGRSEELKIFRRLIESLYPASGSMDVFERQRRAEAAVRTIYIHAHMDEDNFDGSRAMLCPDLVPAEPGRLIPACTYNLFYRMQDERFYREAQP